MSNGEPRLTMKQVDEKKKATHLTMMVIPHCHGAKTKNYCIPMWLIKSFLGISIACILVVSYFVMGFFNLKYIAVENVELKKVNTAQEKEIFELKDLAGDMRGKLEDLIKLDQVVREKVGLAKAAQGDKASRTIENSRTSDRYQFMTMGLGGAPGTVQENTIAMTSALVPFIQEDMSVTAAEIEDAAAPQTEGLVLELPSPEDEIDTLEELKEQLSKMDELLTQQANAINKLNTDVDKQIALEKALPNAWPVQGRITSGFGWRKNPYSSKSREFHEGIDIATTYGTPIRAAAYGIVTFSGYKAGWGREVIISHGYGYVSQYAHNSQLLVNKGDKVERGQIIARLGSTGRSTGPHLHFGVAKDGKWINPLSLLKR